MASRKKNGARSRVTDIKRVLRSLGVSLERLFKLAADESAEKVEWWVDYEFYGSLIRAGFPVQLPQYLFIYIISNASPRRSRVRHLSRDTRDYRPAPCSW